MINSFLLTQLLVKENLLNQTAKFLIKLFLYYFMVFTYFRYFC